MDALLRAGDIYSGRGGRSPLISIGKTKFFAMLKAGEFPLPDARVGGAVLWKLSTVQRWIEETCSAGGA